jgi:hypothetical protein
MESAETVMQSILASDAKREVEGAGMYRGSKGVGRIHLGYWS